MMYLSEETWRKNGVRDKTNIKWVTSAGNMFPNCAKYADALKPIAASKNCDTFFGHTVFKVEDSNRKVFFKKVDGTEVSMDYDFLHLVPPQTAPDFVTESGLAAANGFIDVDQHSLRHNKHSNIFALGDASNLPTAKTAAGIYS